MTADFEAAPDPQNAEPVGDPTLIRLRSDLAALRRLGKQYDRVSGGDAEGVLQLVAPWLPVAEGRLQAAEGSPSDQARWQSLIDEVRTSSEADFVRASSAARLLLRELTEAFLPGPSVSEIADRVRRGIADGVLPPGTLLSRLRILADAGLTSASGTRVDLALQDLAADGLVVVRHSNQVLVAGRKTCDQVTVAADLLRTLVSTGIYPPLSSLPGQQDLSRLLAAERPIVSRALHRLHEEGYLSVQPSRRAVVRPVPPVPVSGPPTLEDLVRRLRSAAPSGTNLDRAGLRKSCRRAKVWWHRRSAPDAESLREVRQSLVASAADLLPLAARRRPDAPDAHAVLGYTVTAALHDWPAEREIEVWRLACVATAVLDVLDLAGDAA
ncbi:GntR family transcriptional regulator [Streptomyces sp. NRRL F-5727]|uniref:GntR family transcriptional regulator n=1 Tax=Streptomyces sp. NRRL F-5727 TaxID=1463871 RepID=UPI0006921D5B|nr:GntR family transcriptional regulator [Streptomyces sp. NRRL F-5727]